MTSTEEAPVERLRRLARERRRADELTRGVVTDWIQEEGRRLRNEGVTEFSVVLRSLFHRYVEAIVTLVAATPMGRVVVENATLLRDLTAPTGTVEDQPQSLATREQQLTPSRVTRRREAIRLFSRQLRTYFYRALDRF